MDRCRARRAPDISAKSQPQRFGAIGAKPEPDGIRTLGKGCRKRGALTERNARIRERYAYRETQESIGRDYHLTKQAISVICRGVERRPDPREERNGRIRKAYAEGESQTKIAKREGLSQQWVCQICKGVERKTVEKEENA